MLLGLTMFILVVALSVAAHQLTEYEWPWHRLAARGPVSHSPPEPMLDGLLGASRTLLPQTEAESTNKGGEETVSAFTGSDPWRDELPDFSTAIPDGCEEMVDEDIPLAAPTEPETEGVDLEEYFDKLDELALRVSFLVTGQLKNELMPALLDWLNESGLTGDRNLKSVLATVGPPQLDEEEIAAKNRYFLELYEQATNQPD